MSLPANHPEVAAARAAAELRPDLNGRGHGGGSGHEEAAHEEGDRGRSTPGRVRPSVDRSPKRRDIRKGPAQRATGVTNGANGHQRVKLRGVIVRPTKVPLQQEEITRASIEYEVRERAVGAVSRIAREGVCGVSPHRLCPGTTCRGLGAPFVTAVSQGDLALALDQFLAFAIDPASAAPRLRDSAAAVVLPLAMVVGSRHGYHWS